MISFDNTEYAFAYKTTKELKRANFLFSSMGNPLLLNTGLKLMPLAMKLHIPFTRSIIRQTIFKQFVGGETLEQTAVVADKLGRYNVQVILDYGVEGGDDGEAGYDHATEEFIKVIGYAATQNNIPLMSIKVTGIVRFGLLEKIDSGMNSNEGTLMKRYYKVIGLLGNDEKAEWERAVARLVKICETANRKKIGVLVDAEETWIQDPVDALTILMMDTYNKEKAVVYNTIQLYRHDRLAFLKASHEAATERGFVLGAKLVRGAYMEKERKRAAEMGYPSPIQPSKEACDKDYNDAVEFSIEHLDNIALIVASHNEYSNLYATQLLDKKGLPHNHPHVHFSQLYGMSDNITFNLAKSGCSVSKYLPFGPIKDVVPYLMRRAQENSSVAGQTGRELGLIKKELERRGQLRIKN
ncbi:proline dehydrogenase family protein [Ferruginibacter sp. HRS2-29]|uniref:proline dehydrogenase family protein n=1 Tax=Ferruginibacter sp. HRS2-29 TaxID=2487334 RepID=UPI0020CCE25A|nr:proline dehydrogenase family protein [Ferruginibacter sp. HRS2-29]MCP9749434.1 proline dehydrogenase [Ferruginibacter sp. HRS2-29]